MSRVKDAPRQPKGRRHEPERRWVYLWHAPIRAMHWIAAVAIVVLVVTGFYIGRPYFFGGGEPGSPFVMGWMRFFHFAAAGVFVATGIVRVYWLFVGNRYERWTALFPVKPEDWKNLWLTLRKYALVELEAPPHYLGHNPLQQLSYTFLYFVAVVMVVTGFTMYGFSNPGGFFHQVFAWVPPLLGGNQAVRFWHHVLTWVFIVFIPVHVYLTIRADTLHRRGVVSSMVGGGKFVPADRTYEDE